MSMAGQRVLVVGASSGIGLATAEAFGTAGATVTMASRGGPKLELAAEQLGARSAALNVWSGVQI
ncbi:SDR family NAD(P)-dependent oxidoreductase [Novosphingobium sp. P6W]|uniref:SDR family NAD(P)-dependent oxidoreductase n=1 Tax=Novosphingobium sp. P6W TaxID=1609758 RepID=UPI0005C2F8D5|nr:SDR family NAD(P)-dependent oxidoreductase [Novosphingobium sp. P6W]AXB80497.1 SDR family NAD(P)-dependent oxidoreductase [Novosphingobium sp. P6W]KIS29455.1 hypothetical protein TQ38_28335 [Novosphingobium sp. P6W]